MRRSAALPSSGLMVTMRVPGSTKPRAAHVEFESHNAASAAGSNPGQIAFVVFEVRDDLVLPLQRHRNIVFIRGSRDRKFCACGHQRRCEEKNTEQLRLQHLQPKLGPNPYRMQIGLTADSMTRAQFVAALVNTPAKYRQRPITREPRP